jgi:hypothetical protein
VRVGGTLKRRGGENEASPLVSYLARSAIELLLTMDETQLLQICELLSRIVGEYKYASLIDDPIQSRRWGEC